LPLPQAPSRSYQLLMINELYLYLFIFIF
jgi:hypothetical protein